MIIIMMIVRGWSLDVMNLKYLTHLSFQLLVPYVKKGLVPLEERIVYDSMESNKILGLGDL